ncbi:MAG: DUF4363 family protein [Plectolyngbya sp. WJT66-NPBG17]|jgi:major membrane immunogen (membrane-anchored lipoprotein)|nr:DUF4363 family protein [Plectolyngbya sp. WJT66-NPBG17]MBW4527359.1 DUF4363 family protein [Phormidium tanganyikae FI6-MK23]
MKTLRFSTFFSLIAGLLVLTACGSKDQPAAQSPSAAQSPLPVPAAPAAPAAGISSLQTVISNTTTAVNAGDFPKAKGEFDKFEDSWETVEDGIKQKAPSTYEAIEANMDKVEDALKTSNKAQSLAALQALGQQVVNATKS